MLWHFLHFRLDVVTRRLEHELEALKKRIHILEGFEKVFDALDEILKIVRKSDGKADAAQKIIRRVRARRRADRRDPRAEDVPAGAARDPRHPQELAEKRKRAKEIGGAAEERGDRWKIVRAEIEQIQKKYGDARRTKISSDEGESEYTAEDFIIEEDNVVIVSRDGWVKRQKEVKDIATTRLREGDAVLAVLPGSTRATVVFFTNFGVAYSVAHRRHPGVDRLRRADPAALQAEGRRADRRAPSASIRASRARSRRRRKGPSRRCTLSRVTSDGYSLRFSFEPFVEPSTRAGRRYARAAEGAEVVGVSRLTGGEILIAATREARAILTKADEVNFLSGPGRGVILIKLDKKEDRVLGFIASTGDRDLMTVETTPGGRADDQHHEVRGHRPRRQGPRAAAARPVHEGRAGRPGRTDTAVLRGDAHPRLAAASAAAPSCLRVRDGFCHWATRAAGRA